MLATQSFALDQQAPSLLDTPSLSSRPATPHSTPIMPQPQHFRKAQRVSSLGVPNVDEGDKAALQTTATALLGLNDLSPRAKPIDVHETELRNDNERRNSDTVLKTKLDAAAELLKSASLIGVENGRRSPRKANIALVGTSVPAPLGSNGSMTPSRSRRSMLTVEPLLLKPAMQSCLKNSPRLSLPLPLALPYPSPSIVFPSELSTQGALSSFAEALRNFDAGRRASDPDVQSDFELELSNWQDKEARAKMRFSSRQDDCGVWRSGLDDDDWREDSDGYGADADDSPALSQSRARNNIRSASAAQARRRARASARTARSSISSFVTTPAVPVVKAPRFSLNTELVPRVGSPNAEIPDANFAAQDDLRVPSPSIVPPHESPRVPCVERQRSVTISGPSTPYNWSFEARAPSVRDPSASLDPLSSGPSLTVPSLSARPRSATASSPSGTGPESSTPSRFEQRRPTTLRLADLPRPALWAPVEIRANGGRLAGRDMDAPAVIDPRVVAPSASQTRTENKIISQSKDTLALPRKANRNRAISVCVRPKVIELSADPNALEADRDPQRAHPIAIAEHPTHGLVLDVGVPVQADDGAGAGAGAGVGGGVGVGLGLGMKGLNAPEYVDASTKKSKDSKRRKRISLPARLPNVEMTPPPNVVKTLPPLPDEAETGAVADVPSLPPSAREAMTEWAKQTFAALAGEAVGTGVDAAPSPALVELSLAAVPDAVGTESILSPIPATNANDGVALVFTDSNSLEIKEPPSQLVEALDVNEPLRAHDQPIQVFSPDSTMDDPSAPLFVPSPKVPMNKFAKGRPCVMRAPSMPRTFSGVLAAMPSAALTLASDTSHGSAAPFFGTSSLSQQPAAVPVSSRTRRDAMNEENAPRQSTAQLARALGLAHLLSAGGASKRAGTSAVNGDGNTVARPAHPLSISVSASVQQDTSPPRRLISLPAPESPRLRRTATAAPRRMHQSPRVPRMSTFAPLLSRTSSTASSVAMVREGTASSFGSFAGASPRVGGANGGGNDVFSPPLGVGLPEPAPIALRQDPTAHSAVPVFTIAGNASSPLLIDVRSPPARSVDTPSELVPDAISPGASSISASMSTTSGGGGGLSTSTSTASPGVGTTEAAGMVMGTGMGTGMGMGMGISIPGGLLVPALARARLQARTPTPFNPAREGWLSPTPPSGSTFYQSRMSTAAEEGPVDLLC